MGRDYSQLSTEELLALHEQVKTEGFKELPPSRQEGFINEAIENFDVTGPLSDTASFFRPFLPDARTGTATPGGEQQTQLLAGLGRLGLGAAAELSPVNRQKPAGELRPTTENQALFRQFAEQEARRLTPEGFKEDPARSLAFLSSFPLGRLGRAAQMLDPATAIVRGSAAAVRAAPKAAEAVLGGTEKAKEVAAEAFGQLTGQGRARSDAMVRAGELEVDEMKSARQAMKEGSPGKLGREVQASIKMEDAALGEAKRNLLETAEDVNVKDLKDELLGDVRRGGEGGLLSQLKIDVEPVGEQTGGLLVHRPGELVGGTKLDLKPPVGFESRDTRTIEGQLRNLLEGSDRISAKDLDDIRGAIATAHGKVAPQAQRILTIIRNRIDEELRRQVPGYTSVNSEIAHFRGRLEGIEDTAETGPLFDRGKVSVKPQALGKKMASAFDDSPSVQDRVEGVEDPLFVKGRRGDPEAFSTSHRTGGLAELDDLTPGIDVRTRAGGIGFHGWSPKGLVGKQQFFQAFAALGVPVSAVGAVSGVDAALATAAVATPVLYMAFIPRVAGEVLVRVGQAAKRASNLQGVTQRLVHQAEQMGIPVTRTTTLPQLLGRMPEDPEEEDVPSLVGQIGSASLAPGQTAQVRPRKLNEPGLSLGDPFAPSR